MTVVSGGDATAIGENTVATGTVRTNVVDSGPVTIASGTSTFTAAAASDDSTPTYASASSYADVSGADFVLTFNRTSSNSGTTGDGTNYASETSSTHFLAIDIEGVDLPGGPVVLEQTMPSPQYASGQLPGSGNLAVLDVDAQSHGDNTFVAVDTYAITVEDQLSSVAVIAVTDVG